MRMVKIDGSFVRELHFSRDGETLFATWGNSHHPLGVKILDQHGRSKARDFPVPFGEMALTADLTALARVNIDRKQMPPLVFLEVYDLASHERRQRLALRLNLTCLAFSPDSQLLLVAGTDYASGIPAYEVDRWLWRNAKDLPPLTVPGPVISMLMTADRRMLVTGGGDNAVRFWRNDTGVVLDEWKHKAPVRRLTFIDRDRFLIAAAGCSVAVWDVANRRQRIRLRPHRKQVNDLAVSADGRLLATASSDGTVRLLDLATCTEMRSFAWEIGRIGAVAFAPDGLTIAAGGENGKIIFWDVDV